jgi:chemotaxis signal transduction protein
VHDVDLVVDAAVADVAAPTAAERAQAVHCGERWIAFAAGWARSAIDLPPLAAVPGAPSWLAGAANVEGQIVPVIDLAAWLAPERDAPAPGTALRLLVGGQGSDAVAVLFHGLPRLVRLRRGTPSPHGDRLLPFAIGTDDSDDATVVIDAPRWVEALIDELTLR